jgi:DNA-binding CsgD family transcriptional regulator
MLEDAILEIGSARFPKVLFEEARRSLILRQMVVYRYQPDKRVELMLAESAGDDENMHQGIQAYSNNFYHRDPLGHYMQPTATRQLNIHYIEAAAIEDEAFRNNLYVSQQMGSKTAITVQRPSDTLIISLFRGDDVGGLSEQQWVFIREAAGYIAAAVERHLELSSPLNNLSWPTRLERARNGDLLSRQEAAVCGLILEGYFNEAIALRMGISVHSVITYRRRAFAKLGISSQNELFNLVLKGKMN